MRIASSLLLGLLASLALFSSLAEAGKIKRLLFADKKYSLELGQEDDFCLEEPYELTGFNLHVVSLTKQRPVDLKIWYPKTPQSFFTPSLLPPSYVKVYWGGTKAKSTVSTTTSSPAKPFIKRVDAANLQGKQICVNVACQGSLKDGSVFRTCEYTLGARRPTQGQVHAPQKDADPKPVCGYADLHLHQFAYLGFGGNWFEHSYDGPLDPKAAKIGYLSSGIHGKQQIHVSWLEEAHKKGLTLAFIPVLSNDFICFGFTKYECSDMTAALRQIRAAHRFAAKYSKWYGIARDPWEARRIISSGRLAVVLTMEVSEPFPEEYGPWVDQLNEVYDMGVRSLFLSHEYDSRFSGCAPQLPLLEALQFVKHGHVFKKDANGRNMLGLTADGTELVKEMMKRNMLIDLGHISWKAVGEVTELTKAANYPLYESHSRFYDLIEAEDKKHVREFCTDVTKLETIKARKGVVGLRTASNFVETYTPKINKDVKKVENTCQGSSTSMAQEVQYGADHGVNLAFGSDLDGWAEQTGPRFGKDACPAPPKGSKKKQYRKDQAAKQKNPLGTDFDTKGCAHVGLVPDLITEMKQLHAATESLEHSAENVLRMWERAYGVESDGRPYATDCHYFQPPAAGKVPTPIAGGAKLNEANEAVSPAEYATKAQAALAAVKSSIEEKKF